MQLDFSFRGSLSLIYASPVDLVLTNYAGPTTFLTNVPYISDKSVTFNDNL